MAKLAGLSVALEPVPAGVYTCRVEELTDEVSKSGKAMWKLRVVIQDDGPYQGRSLFDYFVVEDSDGGPSSIGIRRLASFLSAAGVPVVDDEFDPADAVYQSVMVRTEVEHTDNGTTERIRGYMKV